MRFAQFAVRVWGCEMNFESPEKTAAEGIEHFRLFLKSIGMPTSFSELQIPKDSIDDLVAHRKLRGFPFGTFVPIDEKAMGDILRIAAK
jgi:alcohol dehydrogenase YqhD (iron-dependent ADH family)